MPAGPVAAPLPVVEPGDVEPALPPSVLGCEAVEPGDVVLDWVAVEPIVVPPLAVGADEMDGDEVDGSAQELVRPVEPAPIVLCCAADCA